MSTKPKYFTEHGTIDLDLVNKIMLVPEHELEAMITSNTTTALRLLIKSRLETLRKEKEKRQRHTKISYGPQGYER